MSKGTGWPGLDKQDQRRIKRVTDKIKESGIPGGWPQELIAAGRLIAFRSKAYLGCTNHTMVILLSGVVLRQHVNGMHTTAFGVDGAGNIFGPLHEDGGRSNEILRTLQPGVILQLSTEEFFRRFHRDEQVRRVYMSQIARRCASDALRASMLTSASAETRIRYMLALMADEHGVAGDTRGIMVNLNITRQEIGQLAGTTLETVIRVIRGCKKAGLVVKGKKQGMLFVPDIERLRPEHLDR